MMIGRAAYLEFLRFGPTGPKGRGSNANPKGTGIDRSDLGGASNRGVGSQFLELTTETRPIGEPVGRVEHSSIQLALWRQLTDNRGMSKPTEEGSMVRSFIVKINSESVHGYVLPSALTFGPYKTAEMARRTAAAFRERGFTVSIAPMVDKTVARDYLDQFAVEDAAEGNGYCGFHGRYDASGEGCPFCERSTERAAL